MKIVRYLRSFMPLGILLGACPLSPAVEKPNILIFLGDDVGYEAFGCTGNEFAETPHVDQLASEGLVFDRFYTTIAQCCPARAELYTGLFPHNNGVFSNDGAKEIKAGVRSVADFLVPLGYRVGLAGKSNFWQGKPFETIEGFPTVGKSPKFDYHLKGVRSYVQSAKDSGQPFCMVVGSTHAHYPWNAGEPRMDEIANVVVPDQYVDTQKTREILVRHAAEVTVFDHQLGELRMLLAEEGVEENTIILFMSEQGISLPRSKWSVYEKGNRSLVIAHYPKGITPGRTNAIAQYCDVLPTLIDIAGGDDPLLDGFSFRGVIDGKTQQHRKSALIYGVNPTRQWALIEDEFRLVWSPYRSDRHLMDFYEDLTREKSYGYAWVEWLEKAKSDPVIARKIRHVVSPNEFELYRIDSDYDEVSNLALNPEYKSKLGQLTAEMTRMVGATDSGRFPPRLLMKSVPSRQVKKP